MVVMVVTICSLLFIAYPRKTEAKNERVAYVSLSAFSIALLIVYICGYFPVIAHFFHNYMIAVIRMGRGYFDA